MVLRNHQGAQIDLVRRLGDRLYGIERKRTDAPRRTPSMRSAMEDHAFDRVMFTYPGTQRYAPDARSEVFR